MIEAKLGITATDTQSDVGAIAAASTAALLSVVLVLVAGILRVVSRMVAAKSALVVLLALWIGLIRAPLLGRIIAAVKLRLAGWR